MNKHSAVFGSVLLLSLPQTGLGADPPLPSTQSVETGRDEARRPGER